MVLVQNAKRKTQNAKDARTGNSKSGSIEPTGISLK